MAWLRLDDGFTHHPKFERWTIPQRWAWLECLEYCARYRTAGRIPRDLSLLPRSVTPRLIELAKRSGWINVDDSGDLWINDWETYNPPRPDDLEAAVKEALEANPNASANELFRLVGGSRNQVLKLIRRYRPGTEAGTATGTDTSIARAFPSRPVRTDVSPRPLLQHADEPDPTGDDEPAPSGDANGATAQDYDHAGQYLPEPFS